jgi:hypothetical protein
MRLNDKNINQTMKLYDALIEQGLTYFSLNKRTRQTEERLKRSIHDLSYAVCRLIGQYVLFRNITSSQRRRRLASMGFNIRDDLPYCDAAFGNATMTNGLVVAELTESFMGAQNKGWDCGGSNGEALSRFLAELESGGPAGALAGFATGPDWDRAGRPNWIDATEPTDQDSVSTGCGVVYLYWMMSQGHTPAQIAQAGCPDGSLASNYQALTGRTSAWNDFLAAVNRLPHGVDSDDPWGAAPPDA